MCVNNAIRERVFVGTSDLFRVRFLFWSFEQGRYVPFPFENASRMSIQFDGITVDETNLTAGQTIDVSEGDGRVLFRLGAVSGISAGNFINAIVRVYDSAHPAGQTLAHPSLPQSSLQLIISN